MNFGDLTASIIEDIFPSGEPENLVNTHGKMLVQALVDLQNVVPCLRYGNKDFHPQCSTYFNCGMTVLPQPNGQVLRVYTIGKTQTTGATPGTSVGTLAVNAPLVQLISGEIVVSPALTGTLCTIPTSGVYTISVDQVNKLGALYPANSPQYIRTELQYTDSDGQAHVIQPADLIHISDTDKSGSVSVDCGAGTLVTYTITPYNAPVTDGTFTVNLSVTVGSKLSDSDDWCSKVYYDQVAYGHIDKYVRACNSCQSSIWAVANAITAQLFGRWRQKRLYNPPTDTGFENQPPLPHGFHYPQQSTDAGGRSRGGVYAIKQGNIYIAPWIESTESVVVEWNGIKTVWAPADLVVDDPLFIKAVRLNFAIQHYTHYEDNSERLANFKRQYYGEKGAPGVLRELINQCRERNRVRADYEVGGTAGDSALGTAVLSGTASNSNTFYNMPKSYTATCQSGTGTATVDIPAGRYSSSMSQADADAQALAAATSQANSLLSCSDASSGGGLFLNAERQYTASCPDASGDTPAASGVRVTIVIAAGTYQAASQAVADATALQAAKVTAISQLNCTYLNAPQTVSVTCVDNSTQTVTIPAGSSEYSSTKSQDDANSKANQAAQTQAVSACVASAGAFTAGNTLQIVDYTFVVTSSCGTQFPSSGKVLVPANTFVAQTTPATSAATVTAMNQQAQVYAQLEISSIRVRAQLVADASCWQRTSITGR